MSKSALVILARGFEEIEALTPIDLLRRAGVAVTTAGCDAVQVSGAHGVTVVADRLLRDVASIPFDALILPGGQPGTTNLCASPLVIDLVRRHFQAHALCAAICAAPLVLDAAGVLTGRRFTCFPGVEKEIRQGEHTGLDVVCDGNIITSRAVGTAIPFGLQCVASLISPDTARDLAHRIVFNHELTLAE